MSISKDKALEAARLIMSTLLSPACKANGLSLKTMPDDATAGVIRTAMLIPFAQQVSTNSSTVSSSASARQTGMLNVQCYVLVLASSMTGPRGAEWACGVASQALDNVLTGRGSAYPELPDSKVYVKSTDYTSYKDGVWQYRLSLDLQFPYSSGNAEAKADTTVLDVSW